MVDKIHELLYFWFGDVGKADLPNSDRTNLWFGDNDVVRNHIVDHFNDEFELASVSKLGDWSKTARGQLGLIILLDQVSRYLYRHSDRAFTQDKLAQEVCIAGMEAKMDHALTLIERVFFYMPLVHAEDTRLQEQSIRLYQELASLSMSETTQIYQLFLAYAYAHFRVIKEFGRFPQRNQVLGRISTNEELAFLKNT